MDLRALVPGELSRWMVFDIPSHRCTGVYFGKYVLSPHLPGISPSVHASRRTSVEEAEAGDKDRRATGSADRWGAAFRLRYPGG